MSSTIAIGRLGNQIIRNLALSILAEKFNLYVTYTSFNIIKNIGIPLYIGTNKYNRTITLDDNNYFSILSNSELNTNLNAATYFQTGEISRFIKDHLHSSKIKESIIYANKFNNRYNNNNDIFIHVRLTDVADKNPGITYYMNALSMIHTFNTIYISTDQPTHTIIKQIIEKYPSLILLNYDEVSSIQYGSTCKNIILSHGSFSAVIGFLAFFSTIYYPEYDTTKIWYGDMFSINGWNKISYL